SPPAHPHMHFSVQAVTSVPVRSVGNVNAPSRVQSENALEFFDLFATSAPSLCMQHATTPPRSDAALRIPQNECKDAPFKLP
ncbi:unnamed protein product, partial [Ceratitis capitata]